MLSCVSDQLFFYEIITVNVISGINFFSYGMKVNEVRSISLLNGEGHYMYVVCYRQIVKQFPRSSIQIFKLSKAVVGRQVSNNVYIVPQILDNSLEKSEG